MKKVLSLVACAAIVVSLTTKVNGQEYHQGNENKINNHQTISKSIPDENIISTINNDEVIKENIEVAEEVVREDIKENIEVVDEVVKEEIAPIEEAATENVEQAAVLEEKNAEKIENEVEQPVENKNEEKAENSQRNIGMVTNMYQVGDKTYIDIDMAEFFRGEEALTEALKDEDGKWCYENGKYYVPDGYYLRNKDREIVTYEVSENAAYYLCEYILNIDTGCSANLANVSSDYFNKYIIDNQKYWEYIDYRGICQYIDNRAVLMWIDINDGQVTSLEMQYTP